LPEAVELDDLQSFTQMKEILQSALFDARQMVRASL
jgi:hypothetical protein